MKRKWLTPLNAVVLALAVPTGALAQGGVLEEIIVTAQKRAQNIQDVPLAVSNLSGEKLDVFTSGGEDIRLLRGRLPSLNIESSFGRAFPRFYIRGYGNTDFDLNASQPVSLVYDEVVQENPILKGFPIFDVGRIEMLRGPQGTLFGRNTPAGIVKVDSRLPSQEFGGYLRATYGRFEALNLEGAINGGISDNWSVRLSGLYQSRDDWVDNNITGEDDALEGFDEFAFRLQALYDAGGAFSGLFNVHYRDLDGTARLFRANIIRQGSNDFVNDFSRDDVFYDGQNFQDLETWGAMARLEWDLGNNTTITSVTGYEEADLLSRGDIDGGYGASFAPPFGPGFIPFESETADGLRDHSQFTQEIRWASNDWGRFDWQVGLFYFDEELTIDSFSFATLFGGGQNGFAVQTQKAEALAVFGSIEFDVSDDTILNAGLRYSDDEKDFVAERFESPLSFLGVGPIGPLFANPDDSEWAADVSLTHYFNEDFNVFGRIARGFRAPSIQGRVLFGDVVSVADTETSVSLEAGFKSTLMDGRARFNASVFAYTVDDTQLTAVGGGANFNTLINADKTEGAGFEAELEALVTDNFLVTAGLSYNDTEIKDDDLAIQPCGAPCTVLNPDGPIPGTVLIDGNPLPQAPEWVFNATARYSQPVATGEFFVFADLYYRDEVNFFLYESEEFQGDSLFELGLRLGYIWGGGRHELALFGRNITDEQELVGGIDFNNLTGFVNEPAFWGLQYTINL